MSTFVPTFSTQKAANSSVKRLQKEAADMRLNPPPNCSAGPKGDNLYDWGAVIDGPIGTPYEGGTFLLELRFPSDYPFKPPKLIFKTRIYHCNINSQGVVCLDTLQDEWTPAMSVRSLLLSVVTLMENCNPDDPLVGCIAKQYKANKEKHDQTARLWTQRFAQ